MGQGGHMDVRDRGVGGGVFPSTYLLHTIFTNLLLSVSLKEWWSGCMGELSSYFLFHSLSDALSHSHVIHPSYSHTFLAPYPMQT